MEQAELDPRAWEMSGLDGDTLVPPGEGLSLSLLGGPAGEAALPQQHALALWTRGAHSQLTGLSGEQRGCPLQGWGRWVCLLPSLRQTRFLS